MHLHVYLGTLHLKTKLCQTFKIHLQVRQTLIALSSNFRVERDALQTVSHASGDVEAANLSLFEPKLQATPVTLRTPQGPGLQVGTDYATNAIVVSFVGCLICVSG